MVRKTIVSVSLLVIACRPAAPTKPPADRDPLIMLADRIDPGAQDSIDARLPPWLAEALGVTDRPDVGAMFRWLASNPTPLLSTDESSQFSQLLELLGAAASLERRIGGLDGAARVDAEFVLAEVYGRLDLPIFGAQNQQTAAQLGLELLHSANETIGARFEEAWPIMQGVLTDAGQKERALLARLMREVDSHDPRLAVAMLEAAGRKYSGPPGRDELELARRAIALQGEAAAPDHMLEAAFICARGLAIDCADDMLGRARGRAQARDVKWVTAFVGKARRVVALQRTRGIEPELERAGLLRELGRGDDALAAYGEAARHYPGDARAVIGRERAQLSIDLDFPAAAKRIEQLPTDLEHKDADYYEYVIGVRSGAWGIMAEEQHLPTDPRSSIAAVYPKIAADVRAFAALGTDKGVLLQYMFELGTSASPNLDGDAAWALSDRALVDLMKLRERFPDSPHLHRMLVASAIFASDRVLADRALALPLPRAADQQLLQLVLLARQAAAIVWQRPALELDLAGLDSQHAIDVELLRDDATAIAAVRNGDTAAWRGLFERYYATVRADLPITFRRANAIAVALVRAGGEPKEAQEFLELSVAYAERKGLRTVRGLPLVNLVALGGRSRDELEEVANQGEEMAPFALAMLVEGSRGAARRRWKAQLAKLHVRCSDVEGGFVIHRQLDGVLRYSTTAGLEMGADVVVTPGLLLDGVIAPVRAQKCR